MVIFLCVQSFFRREYYFFSQVTVKGRLFHGMKSDFIFFIEFGTLTMSWEMLFFLTFILGRIKKGKKI
jgi:hypothetical protein